MMVELHQGRRYDGSPVEVLTWIGSPGEVLDMDWKSRGSLGYGLEVPRKSWTRIGSPGEVLDMDWKSRGSPEKSLGITRIFLAMNDGWYRASLFLNSIEKTRVKILLREPHV